MSNINLEKAMEYFCKRYNICADKEEKLLIQLAIQHGIALKIIENINELKRKELNNDTL